MERNREKAALRDKILEAAQDVIRRQEGSPTTVLHWRYVDARNHEILSSITIATETGEFEVWAIVNTDTEEVCCI